MSWLILLAAGAVEITFVMLLAGKDSFRRFWPTVLVLFFGVFSVYLLALAMRGLPVGTAFAVWSAIGAGGAVFLGVVFRGEPANALRLVGLATAISGAVLLRLAGG